VVPEVAGSIPVQQLPLMTKRVGGALRDKRDKGLVRSVEGAGLYQLWEVVRQ